jgi:hypothetical protein
MKVEIIEYLILGVIIACQGLYFHKTRKNIKVYKGIIPDLSRLSILRMQVLLTDLEKLSPQVILENIVIYKGQAEGVPSIFLQKAGYPNEEVYSQEFRENGLLHLEDEAHIDLMTKAEINILECKGETNPILFKIIYSINNYLIRNRGASSDFNLIKDIVERNTNAVEEDINLSVSIPLYLGLMGTMLGIVIGLFTMPDMSLVLDSQANNSLLNEGISSLIGGVKIAMIASFIGLVLTIINSGYNFKGSRIFVEANKNELYTFIQVELLPIINQGLSSTLESLHRNLMKFNGEFTSNLARLSGIFDGNTRTILAQKELLDAIDKVKVSEMSQYNLKVLKQLDVSIKEFEKFNSSMLNVNSFVLNSERIVDRTNELLKRTDNFQVIANNLEEKMNQSHQLMEFLTAHFNNLEQHKQFTVNSVADVGHAISASFKGLQEHILNSSEAVKKFTVDETELLKKALSESKSNLSNLHYLSTLSQDLSVFKDSSASQGDRLRQQLDDLNINMAESVALLEKAKHERSQSKKKKPVTSIWKKMFGSNK